MLLSENQKIARKTLFLVILTSIACNVFSINADASVKPSEINSSQQPSKSVKNSSPITPLDEIIDAGHKQLNQVAIAVVTLSGVISATKDQLKNQSAVLEHLKSLNGMIHTMRSQKFAEVDWETAYMLLQFNNLVAQHVTELINTNFRTLEKSATENIVNRCLPTTEVDPAQVVELLITNEQKFDALTKNVDQFGLAWYNRAYRKLDDYVLTPVIKHDLIRRSLLAGTIAALVAYGSWRYDPKILKQYWPSRFWWMWGDVVYHPYVPGAERTAPQPEDAQGAMYKTEQFFGELLNRWSPVGQFLGGSLIGLGALEYKKIQPKLSKQWTIWNNWLRGGSHLREAKRAAEKVENVRWNDVCGQDEIIRYFKLIVDYLENPEPYDRLGLTPPKGILCVGDTRTGKTFAVTALFGEIQAMLKRTGRTDKFKFISLSAAKINYYGIKTLLEDIKAAAPCIVFIDEIDLLDLQRIGKNETLSEFLTCMSGTINSKDTKNQVILIAATNRPENLDVALRQPGRFGKELRFEYPNKADRAKFLTRKLEKLSLDVTQVDIEKLARNTENKSYEALNQLIDNALLKARINGQMITQECIEETLDEDLRRIIPANTKNIPTHEKEILAAHFAGQALTLMLLDGHTKLATVTIKQVMTDIKEEMMGMHLMEKDKKDQTRFEYGKIFTSRSHDSINLNTKEEKLNLCKFNLAGFVAEELLLGACGYSCHAENNKSAALTLAQSIAFEGLDLSKMPKSIQVKKHEYALAIMEQCKQEVTKLLSEHKAELAALAKALQEAETLDLEHAQIAIKDVQKK